MDQEISQTPEYQEISDIWQQEVAELVRSADPEPIPPELAKELVKAWYRKLAQKAQSTTVLPVLDYSSAYIFPHDWGAIAVIDGTEKDERNRKTEGKRVILIDGDTKEFMGYGGIASTHPGGSAEITFRIFESFRGGKVPSRQIFSEAVADALLTFNDVPPELIVPVHQQLARTDLREQQTAAPIFYRRMGFHSESDPAFAGEKRLSSEQLSELAKNEVSQSVSDNLKDAIAVKREVLGENEPPELSPVNRIMINEAIASTTVKTDSRPDRAALSKLAEKLKRRE